MSKLFLHEYIRKLAGTRFISYRDLTRIVFDNVMVSGVEFLIDYFYIDFVNDTVDLCKPKKLAEIIETTDDDFELDFVRIDGDLVDIEYCMGHKDMQSHIVEKRCSASDVRKKHETFFALYDGKLYEYVGEEIQPTYYRYHCYEHYNILDLIGEEDIPF